MSAVQSAVRPTIEVIWTTHEWADAIVRLPVDRPLPSRTVLVPGEAVAHALRRKLIRNGHPEALAGTRFLLFAVAASHVLQNAGVDVVPGEEAMRRARLLALFRSGLALEHFPLDLLRDKPGWDEAFARTIGDLEGAGLQPEHLDAFAHEAGRDAGRLRDVGRIWRALDESAGRSWTVQHVYMEAARALAERPDRWSFPAPVFAVATAHGSPAQARFLRSIPGVQLALLGARPLREAYVRRVDALFGAAARDAVVNTTPPRAHATERDLLASYLFEPPALLAEPQRPRSGAPDGTVDLEEHAGVDAELEATADWVARQVLEGTPLEDIAVLVPSVDPLAGLVAKRLARLPWGDGTLPVHVAGGLPLVSTAGGARALAVVRALRTHLSGNALADVLPALRTVTPAAHEEATNGDAPFTPRHLAHGAATDLVWSLGTAGGNAAEPRRALEWSERAAARELDLARQLEEARAAGDDPERAGVAREARDLERLLRDLRAVRPALDALVAVARLVVTERPLADLWPALADFFATHVLRPSEGPRVHALLLDERLLPLTGGATGELTGDDALRLIEETVTAIRVSGSRFGEPAVYIGAVRDAIALPFRAVRVIGLAEGHLPPPAHEDPVLPDRLRERLRIAGAEGDGGSPAAPSTAPERALAALHALDAVVRNTTHLIALSAPRLDVERSQREPSSILLEAAAALGRPDRVTGERQRTIPDLRALRRDAFAPARAAADRFRLATPLTESAWQDAVARGALAIPQGWRAVATLDLDRIAGLATAGTLDGLLGDSSIAVPGLTRERAISPSALGALLQCPHRFLLERVLGLHEPAEAPPLREIGQPYYGALVHRVVETFLKAHGTEYCATQRTLQQWQATLDAIVEREFAAFLEQYPLVGGAVRGIQENRLRHDARDLLAYEWDAGPRRFVATEHPFGEDAPVELPLGSRSLFVRGRIDRIEVMGDATLVRDLKTGRAHPREGKAAEPDPSFDVQIAVYALVAQRFAEAWRVPKTIRAAYAYVGRGVEERAWDDFHEALEPAARTWLAVAAELLAARAFPRTPEPEDCQYCGFRPVCGTEVHERARALLAHAQAPLDGFAVLKGVERDADGAPPAETAPPKKRKKKR